MSSQALPEIKSYILDLSIEDRIEIAKWVWNDLIENPDNIPISNAHRRVLDARIEDARLHPEDEQPWAEVREELKRYLKDS